MNHWTKLFPLKCDGCDDSAFLVFYPSEKPIPASASTQTQIRSRPRSYLYEGFLSNTIDARELQSEVKKFSNKESKQKNCRELLKQLVWCGDHRDQQETSNEHLQNSYSPTAKTSLTWNLPTSSVSFCCSNDTSDNKEIFLSES